MKKKCIDLESKQVIANIHKRREKYVLIMKISMIIWILFAGLALMNIWFMIPYLIIGVIVVISIKKYFSIVDELINTIEILYKRMEIS